LEGAALLLVDDADVASASDPQCLRPQASAGRARLCRELAGRISLAGGELRRPAGRDLAGEGPRVSAWCLGDRSMSLRGRRPRDRCNGPFTSTIRCVGHGILRISPEYLQSESVVARIFLQASLCDRG